jgi:uncharacterized SAM-binding protein YcdF (DUF218 family)
MDAYTIASKILTPLVSPGNFLLALVFVGLVFGDRRWGRVTSWIGGLGLLALATLPGGGAAIAALENRFPSPELPAKVDGIVVLGGSIQTGTSKARGQPTVNDNAERDLAFVTLARRYPEAKLLFTGGTGKLFRDGTTEASIARDLYVGLGLDAARLLLEDRSRNTWENGVFGQDVARPAPGETWLLVTSARHMPRAVGVFRRLNWFVMPYPVDYRTAGDIRLDLGWDLGIGARSASEAFHEWAGLLIYFLLGRTSELFPGPT